MPRGWPKKNCVVRLTASHSCSPTGKPPAYRDTRYKSHSPIPRPTRAVSSPDEKLSCDPEPRSGERYIAWGVSPRIRAKKEKAAERRQKCGADAFGSRRSTNLSPPPGACRLFAVPTLGLPPQAKNMPLLRSSSSGVNLIQDETDLASCILHLESGASPFAHRANPIGSGNRARSPATTQPPRRTSWPPR